MTPPAAKTNGTSGAGTFLKIAALVTALFIGVVGGVLGVKSADRPIPYSELVDERLANMAQKLVELTQIVQQHTLLEMHGGSRVWFTKMQSEQKHILEALDRIEKRLEKIEGG